MRQTVIKCDVCKAVKPESGNGWAAVAIIVSTDHVHMVIGHDLEKFQEELKNQSNTVVHDVCSQPCITRLINTHWEAIVRGKNAK